MKIDKENALAGIVAVVALVAIICELIFGGISTASIAGAVKDIAGITVDILVFLLAFRAFAKKEDKTFRGKLESAMEEIEKSYAPLIQEHKAKETNVLRHDKSKSTRKNQKNKTPYKPALNNALRRSWKNKSATRKIQKSPFLKR